ncbi:inactive hydroxysteroid dehydrogenase-like protein 1 isoform X2 [Diabrotica virgifera virgifera]|uniref:Uncharacterized protein n=2 Tax=Diabrotica virgifera virgifera TaxID=50390 RepID=A0ABM5KWA9_DIAVI|nr:inactive hydroxysteroid dehydrogenase-like protein 1 isoform X2 [Diabrotica virgifera virgifera]
MCYSFGLIVLIFVMPDSIRNIVQMCRALLAASFISNEKTSLAKKFGPWALITGCTDGIGKAYAFELAKRGINIVLVSRNEEKLKKTAQDIVNNVGKLYDYPMYLSEVPEKDLFDMININVVPVTLLCGAFIGDMKKRGRGAIVNVSSGSEMFPLPLMTVYSATKSYIRCFTMALRYEYRNSGITIQHLAPLYVNTKMNAYSNKLQKNSFLIPDAEQYARYAIMTLGKLDETSGYWTHGIQGRLLSSAKRRIILDATRP